MHPPASPPRRACARPLWRPAARRRRASWALLAALALGPPGVVHAAETEPPLVSLDFDGGLFLAYLSGGITSLSTKLDDSPLSDAINSVGTGQGVLMRLGGHLSVLGHDVFFQYVSDQIFDAGASEAIKGQVSSPLVEDALLFLAGELRPDLGGLIDQTVFDVPARTFIRAEFGRFRGDIAGADQFSTRNGRPYFGGSRESWTSRLLTVDAGLIAEEDDRDTRRYGRRGQTKTFHVGYFARYTTFSRPVVLGFGTDGDGYALQDGSLGMVALGGRLGYRSCETTCFSVDANFIPFTGFAWLDVGDFGESRGVALGGGFELRWSLPWNPVATLKIEPYLSFRADWLMPILGDGFSAEIDTAQLWAPDYLLWGPGAGLTLHY